MSIFLDNHHANGYTERNSANPRKIRCEQL
jgi:hypothetical protein